MWRVRRGVELEYGGHLRVFGLGGDGMEGVGCWELISVWEISLSFNKMETKGGNGGNGGLGHVHGQCEWYWLHLGCRQYLAVGQEIQGRCWFEIPTNRSEWLPCADSFFQRAQKRFRCLSSRPI
jgi:hypothetical protein